MGAFSYSLGCLLTICRKSLLTHTLTHSLTHTHTHVAIMSDTHAGALHILKKHEGSRRPSSWRTEAITQSKEEAIAQIGM
jgi:hypothetical protein